MLYNEEDVKNKLVVPYLRSLGFDESELFYERSFDLKVGRYTYAFHPREAFSVIIGPPWVLVTHWLATRAAV
jgi:hypothetical protein